MGRKLGAFVHVDGVAYGPGSEVPADVAERITAPGVWADEAEPEPEPVKPARAAAKPKAD